MGIASQTQQEQRQSFWEEGPTVIRYFHINLQGRIQSKFYLSSFPGSIKQTRPAPENFATRRLTGSGVLTSVLPDAADTLHDASKEGKANADAGQRRGPRRGSPTGLRAAATEPAGVNSAHARGSNAMRRIQTQGAHCTIGAPFQKIDIDIYYYLQPIQVIEY